MALVTALIGITSVVVMNAKRTTTDESLVLTAEYAAEAGLTQAQTRILEFSELLGESVMASNITGGEMESFAKDYCGSYNLATPLPVGQWTTEERENGFVLCDVVDVSQTSFDIFEDTIDPDLFEDMNIMSNATASNISGYWDEILGGGITFNQMIDNDRSVDLNFGFTPVAVKMLEDGTHRFVFSQGETTSTGTVLGENGQVLASRQISYAAPSNEFYIDYRKPSFAYYNLFVEDLNDAYFSPQQSYGGPVHVNGNTQSSGPRFYTDCGGSQEAALFRSIFTTVKDVPHFLNGNTCGGDVNDATMYQSDYKYGSEPITLPPNTNNQRRAVAGTDHTDTSDFSDNDMRSAFNMSSTNWSNGVYYSESDGSTANASDSWLGGIYVKGSVRNLLIKTNNDDRQIIEITLGGTGQKTTFEQETNSDDWTVTRPDGSTQNLNGSFNGLIYVEGNIGRRCLQLGNKTCGRDRSAFSSWQPGEKYMSQVRTNHSNDLRKLGLSGDGTDKPDLASNTRLTIATTGDIVLKQDITYTDDPIALGLGAINVLGLYSNGGSIKMDGPKFKDVNLHATVMASAANRGYGAIDHTAYRGSPKPKIHIVGGVIHNVAQASGTSRSGGYTNQWEADPRFTQGYAPPFFPTQQEWASNVSSGLFNNGATWKYGN